MPLLAATNITKNYGTDIILGGVSISLEDGERIGLVGRNGQGKSTLLKILAGLIRPDSGDLSLARGRRAGYLHQDPDLNPDETLRAAAEGAFAELHRLHDEQHALFDAMAATSDDPAEVERLMRRQTVIERQIESLGGYAIDHKIDATLHGVGLTDAEFNVKVASLSGGQKGRLALARLLLESPDLLLLDEPTNHLDITGRLWLESFLLDEFRGAVVLVSHDRRLLENVVTRIVEVEQARLLDYPGGYEDFIEIRARRRLTQARAFDKQQTKFKAEEAYIRRYKAGQRAKQARGRETRLAREKLDSALERPVELAAFSLELPKPTRSGDIVATARGLSKSYTNKDGSQRVLFNDFDLSIGRGERWAFVGPNGAGKTTLVRALLGDLAPDAGTARLGSNVVVGHYKQIHEGLDPELPVWRYLQKAIQKENPGVAWSEQQARDLGGAFLFSGSEQEKTISVLSGGERSRMVLAGLLASAKNLLVLDEPTNHLDIVSAERLEDALADADENLTLILISHDRAFIDATCDHLVVLDGAGGAQVFHGTWSEWHEKDVERRKAASDAAARERDQRDRAEKQRRAAEESKKRAERDAAGASSKDPHRNALARLTVEQIEQRIEKIESRLRDIDANLADPDVWRDHARSASLGDERSRLLADLEPLEFEWSRRAEDA